MNFFILTVVLGIWLAIVSYMMPLSTLITTRPIGFSIVLVMFGLAGLVVFFANRTEDQPDSADEPVDIPDSTMPLATDVMAGSGAN